MKYLSKLKNYYLGRSERSQIVVKNAVCSLSIKVLSIVVDFAKVPVLLSFLDASHYGVYITIASIVAWTHQFDFGLGSGLRYKLTEAISRHDDTRSKQLISTAYLSMSAIMLGLFLICVPVIINLNWAKILNCRFVGAQELVLCVSMVLAVFVVQFVLELISVVLQADQKTAISNFFKPLSNLLTIVSVLLMRQFAHNSLVLACLAITLPIVVVLFFANTILFARRYKKIAPAFKDFRKERIIELYSLGLKYLAGQFSSLVVFSTANFLISHYVNPTEAAVYNTAWIYFGVLVMFNGMVLTPLEAAVTDAYVTGEERWIKNIYKKIHLYSLVLTIASLVLLAVSQIAFHLWVGDKIIVPWSLSIVMTILFIVNIWNTPYMNFLASVGKMNVLVVASFCKIVIFFPIAIALIKLWGTVGLVMAILIINSLPNYIIGRYQYLLVIQHKAKRIWNK